MQVVSSRDWDRTELGQKGTTPTGEFRVFDIFRPAEDGGLHAYFVRSFSPGATVGLHFHLVPQFQVFAEGRGTFQRHDVDPVTVHFTDPYSTYGPIVAKPEGLGFFVFRTEHDRGGNYMPGSRELLEGHRPGRNLHGTVAPDVTTTATGGPGEVLPLDADGMGSVVVGAGDGERLPVPSPRGSGGQYHLVLNGTIEVDGRELPEWSVVYSAPDEPALEAVARSPRSELLVLRFPLGDGAARERATRAVTAN